MVSIQEAAQAGRISHSTIRKLFNDGKIMGFRCGGKIFVDKNEVVTYADTGRAPRVCPSCGKVFAPKTIDHARRFCSPECRNKHHAQNNAPPGSEKLYELTCVVCGRLFTHKYSHTKTCSPECRKEYYKRYYPTRTRYEIICDVCGKAFIANNPNTKRCSPGCRRRHMKRKHKVSCAYCGKSFKASSPTTQYCSSSCRGAGQKRKNAATKLAKRMSLSNNMSYAEIAKRTEGMREVFGRTIDRRGTGKFSQELSKAIRERDGWQCYICGRETNLHVHHIIPRAEGGLDIPENLVTLCGGCHRSIEAGDVENAIFKCVQRAIMNVG